jgi:hypothetical protein
VAGTAVIAARASTWVGERRRGSRNGKRTRQQQTSDSPLHPLTSLPPHAAAPDKDSTPQMVRRPTKGEPNRCPPKRSRRLGHENLLGFAQVLPPSSRRVKRREAASSGKLAARELSGRARSVRRTRAELDSPRPADEHAGSVSAPRTKASTLLSLDQTFSTAGRTHVLWGEAPAYDGPGNVWYAQER